MHQRFLDFRRRLYDDHDLTAVDEYLHPEFISHSPNIKPGIDAHREFVRTYGPPGPVDVRPAYKAFVQAFHAGFPDLKPVNQKILVEGDRLIAMTQWEGTHAGPFRGVPATGKSLHFATSDLYRVSDHLLVEHWDVVDALDAWIALGLVWRAQA
ncbi:SnoaL-like polyketide cyclase [Rhizobiales bacterium GAS188]|nr:SnoaL-like polyketide cyclase [Rhizobiales bacterium GAS188]